MFTTLACACGATACIAARAGAKGATTDRRGMGYGGGEPPEEWGPLWGVEGSSVVGDKG